KKRRFLPRGVFAPWCELLKISREGAQISTGETATMKIKNDELTRRSVLKAGAGLALGNALGTGEAQAAKPGVYEALGVKTVINATGTVTNLGGSVMPPEVVAAWVAASRHFVSLVDLQDKVGQRIAQLIGVEAALVTTGAAGALLLGTAAAVTGA